MIFVIFILVYISNCKIMAIIVAYKLKFMGIFWKIVFFFMMVRVMVRVIVIAKATNTRFGWPEMAIPGGGLPEQTEMAIPGGMPEKTEMAIPGGMPEKTEMAIPGNLGKKLKVWETVI